MRSWIFIAIVTGVTVVLDRVNRKKELGFDTGGFWARFLDRTVLFLAPPLLVFLFLPEWIGGNSIWGTEPSNALLSGLGFLWLLLGVWTSTHSSTAAEGHWLSATLEFRPQRYWILLFSIPVVPSISYLWENWRLPVYAACWGFLILFVASLAGAALSAHPLALAWNANRKDEKEVDGNVDLESWPNGMRDQGISLKLIQSMPAAPQRGGKNRADEMAWEEICRRLGSIGIPPKLAGAVSSLIEESEDSKQRLILAPDNAGQVELIALAATEVARRYGQLTIIVTPQQDATMNVELNQWLGKMGGDSPAQLVKASKGTDFDHADIILADAEALSEVVLPALSTQAQHQGTVSSPWAGNVGLVIWWDLHRSSGVPAAHLWAISRRLERLLSEYQSIDRRVLVFARPCRYEQSQYSAFLQRLLPYDWAATEKVEIPATFSSVTQVYQLEHPTSKVLREAVDASALLVGWPTAVSDGILDQPVAGIVSSSPAAGARFLKIQPADVLSLPEITCQGGRSNPNFRSHHVVLSTGYDPYVEYLLREMGQMKDPGVSIHLAVAEGQWELVQRHLLLALREVKDTFSGLLSGFRFREDNWRQTLDALADRGMLDRRNVRRLRPDTGRIERDSLYENKQSFQALPGSLKVLGKNPVSVRDPDSELEDLFLVSKERAAIEAYPLAVLRCRGRRYRITDWDFSADGEPPRNLDCRQEQGESQTWRMRISTVTPIEDDEPQMKVSPLGVKLLLQHVEYSETLKGVIQLTESGGVEIQSYPAEKSPLIFDFGTRALIVVFDKWVPPIAARTIAAAWRFMIPAHVALEDGSFEIVELKYDAKPAIAIVELFPGGIGLVDGLAQSLDFIPELLRRTKDWFEVCAGENRSAESVFGNHPLTRATRGPEKLDFLPALELIRTVTLTHRGIAG